MDEATPVRPHSYAFAALAVALSLFVSVLAAEALLRVAFPAPGAPVADPILGPRGSAGGDHDSRGYRNETALEQADIVILGDSQTYGNNAVREDAWPQALARETGTTVYQMAFGGWAATQYHALLDEALALQPKTIIVALYTGNDMLEVSERVYGAEAWALYREKDFTLSNAAESSLDVRLALDSGSDLSSTGLVVYKIRRWLRESFRLYGLLGDATRKLREYANLAESPQEREKRIDAFVESRPELGYDLEDANIGTTLSATYRFRAIDLAERDVREGWRLTQILVREMREKTEAANVRFMVVLIPTKELAYLELTRKKGESVPYFETYEKAERELWTEFEGFCAREHMRCIPVLDALVATLEKGERAYGDDINGHPRAAGYAAIAREVKARLEPL